MYHNSVSGHYPDPNRRYPRVNIPPGAASPIPPSPTAQQYAWQTTMSPPSMDYGGPPLTNPWEGLPDTPRARTQSMVAPQNYGYGQAYNRHSDTTPAFAFPEPQIFRATSATASTSLAPPQPSIHQLTHRHSNSDLGTRLRKPLPPGPSRAAATPPPAASRPMASPPPPPPPQIHRDPSLASLSSVASSYYRDEDIDDYSAASIDSHGDEEISKELSKLSLESEEGIIKFQEGKLLEKDEEWYRLVPDEAREALGKQEVQRQSVIFEVLKSEREYVFDLQAVVDVFILPLRNANPPILNPQNLDAFIIEVFGNFDAVLRHHTKMLKALFERQREQHPLIQSVADIILDTTLKADFRSAYEVYIKHYPLAESHHRKELKRNQAYESFIQSVSNDPRIRKRDLITFLSRPVTRLPRLNLLLEQILKLTDKEYEHPDLETLPIILRILSDCIKSTQPGIEAAESKVKLWALCESLIFQKGEIMDLDLYDKSRTLSYSGPVIRRSKGRDSGWSSWTDNVGALLDHYFILSREGKNQHGVTKRYIVSRPLHLSYLRLGSFKEDPDSRKERSDGDGVLSRFQYHHAKIYPFTIYHAANFDRRYTLYTSNEQQRNKWAAAFKDALAVHKARQEGNMYFEPRILSDRHFRLPGNKTSPDARLTGRITAATPFTSGGRKFLAVGSSTGIYVALRGDERFTRVLNYVNVTSMAAVQEVGNKTFNKFIIHHGSSLVSYSLDLMARVATNQSDEKALLASMEKVIGHDNNVVFFRQAYIARRMLLIYASKRTFQSSLNLNVLEVVDVSEASLAPKRPGAKHRSFRPFGEPGYVPKDAFDITTLAKTIGICASDGIVVLDPTNVANSRTSFVPDFSNASSNDPMALLKSKIEDAKPLGLARANQDELLVVYDTLGCYITKHGSLSRNCGFIKWESKATSFTHRGSYVFLFSSQFIEVHSIITGRLVQVYDAKDIRLLSSGPVDAITGNDPVLVAMRGEKDDRDGASDKIVEFLETNEIAQPGSRQPMPSAEMWDEWDM